MAYRLFEIIFPSSDQTVRLSSATATTTHHEEIIAGRCFIDILPTEILSEIFGHSLKLCRENDGFHAYVSCLSLTSPPFSLLSICKFWRDAALATPSLWDSVCILPSSNSIQCAKAWMRVSPDIPFHLMLTQQIKPQYASELFQLFATISHRWKSLSIRLDTRMAEELLSFLQTNTSNPIPMKDVYISVPVKSNTAVTSMRSIFSLLPISTSGCLERLYWGGDPFTISTTSLLPWKHLKTINVKLTVIATQDIVSILSQCTSASVISISMFPANPEYTPTPMLYYIPAVSLPLLTSLKLSRQTDPMGLLQYLTFPSLRYLWVAVAYRDLITFRKFLKRTPLLETLVIDESGQDHGDSPDGPSEQDIIDYLGIPELCNIPSFKLTFRDAHTVMVSIIEDNPNALTVPSLLCWRECRCLGARYGNCTFIGWGKNWSITEMIWEYRPGQLEFTPEYHSTWYTWRDSTWNRPGGKYFRRPPGVFKCIPLPP